MKEAEKKIDIIINDGAEKLLCVFDFDKTLSYPFWKGKNVSTTFSLFRDLDMISPEYTKESRELFEEYYPKEVSTDLSIEEKAVYMNEWWSKHLELFIKHKINKEMIMKSVQMGSLHLRIGVKEFFENANKKGIPIFVLSAGLGDVILAVLEEEGINYPNIHLISNFYTFNRDGVAVEHNPLIIHSFNKDEASVPEEMLNTFSGRTNILLAGDSVSDLHMTKGLDTKEILSFGFLNGNLAIEQSFRDKFDIVLLDAEESFKTLNDILNKI